MTIEISNNALENCTSIDQVVELINNELLSDAGAEMIAAKYAQSSAEFILAADIEFQLDALVERGAQFIYFTAAKMANDY